MVNNGTAAGNSVAQNRAAAYGAPAVDSAQ
jgi:hypothetical protein